MIFKTAPSVDNMASVEMSVDDGQTWKLLAMAVNRKAASAIVAGLELTLETYSENSLNEVLENLED